VGGVTPGRHRVSALYFISGVLALLLFAYLLYALFKPEKF
jgi:K+-transporting ATPase KdpF subunit